MRYVHSYWTAPKSKNRKLDVLMSAYSVSLIHKLGKQIVLHTDDFGKELLKDVPYDAVYTTLNDLDKEINPHIWSASKFISMLNEPLDSIHIDNDVFIYNENLLLIPEDVKFMALHIIPYNQDYDFVKRYLKKATIDKFNYPEDWDWKCKKCLHLGSFAFNDLEFKDKIINTYLYITKEITRTVPDFLFDLNLPTFIPNLLLEENLLGIYTKDVTVKYICDWKEFNPCSPNELYEHFAGGNKIGWLDYTKNKLKELDTNLYNKVKYEQDSLVKA